MPKYIVSPRDRNSVNIVENTLVDMYGYEESIPLRDRLLESRRYGVLLAIASHLANGSQSEETQSRLERAIHKMIFNPNTRASL